MYRVIFHVDENKKFPLALKNIENLIGDLGEDALEVELLTNSEAIAMMLKDSFDYTEQIRKLASKKVHFAVCSNSMRQMNIAKENLLDIANVVPSGVGELVKKQSEGWGYIRP
jgi:intracellular sulfur oxidation DsrE/DsrF family protein